MILKTKDSTDEALNELEKLLSLPLNNKQRFLVEREQKIFKSGLRGEEDSAYFLNFAYGQSENWALLHDLRIEWKGRVAQIDHLAINRFLEIYVLETKNFFYGVKITDQGEFNVWNGKGYIGIESPVEQNIRHIAVLEDRIKAKGLAPKRLGISIPVSYQSYVLLSPSSRVIRPKEKVYPTGNVIKADQFKSKIDKAFDDDSVFNVLGKATKIVSTATLNEFAQGVAEMHVPASVDYRAKFGIPNNLSTEPDPKAQNNKLNACDKCGAEVDKKVVAYCRFNRAKLGGFKVLCRNCQGSV